MKPTKAIGTTQPHPPITQPHNAKASQTEEFSHFHSTNDNKKNISSQKASCTQQQALPLQSNTYGDICDTTAPKIYDLLEEYKASKNIKFLTKAIDIVKDMRLHNKPTVEKTKLYTARIHVYIKAGNDICISYLSTALSIFKEMTDTGMTRNQKLCNALIQACIRAGKNIHLSYLDEALSIFEEMGKIEEIWKVEMDEIVRNEILYNAIIHACATASLNGNISYLDKALLLFKEMEDNTGIVRDEDTGIDRKEKLHCTIIYACVTASKSGQHYYLDEALSIFQKMGNIGIARDVRLYSTIIHACARAGKNDRSDYLEQSLSIFQEMANTGIARDVILYNAMIHAYIKAAEKTYNHDQIYYFLNQAISLFKEMGNYKKPRNETLYNAIIHACVKAGRNIDISFLNEALLFFNEMGHDAKIVRNVILYHAIIQTCIKVANNGYSNYLDSALQLFQEIYNAIVLHDQQLYYIIVQTCLDTCYKDIYYLNQAISLFHKIKFLNTPNDKQLCHAIIQACINTHHENIYYLDQAITLFHKMDYLIIPNNRELYKQLCHTIIQACFAAHFKDPKDIHYLNQAILIFVGMIDSNYTKLDIDVFHNILYYCLDNTCLEQINMVVMPCRGKILNNNLGFLTQTNAICLYNKDIYQKSDNPYGKLPPNMAKIILLTLLPQLYNNMRIEMIDIITGIGTEELTLKQVVREIAPQYGYTVNRHFSNEGRLILTRNRTPVGKQTQNKR